MEWTVIISATSLFIMISSQLYGYHRANIKKIKEVKDELLVLRSNDLHHINLELSQIKGHVFELAKDK